MLREASTPPPAPLVKNYSHPPPENIEQQSFPFASLPREAFSFACSLSLLRHVAIRLAGWMMDGVQNPQPPACIPQAIDYNYIPPRKHSLNTSPPVSSLAGSCVHPCLIVSYCRYLPSHSLSEPHSFYDTAGRRLSTVHPPCLDSLSHWSNLHLSKQQRDGPKPPSFFRDKLRQTAKLYEPATQDGSR